MDIVIDVQCCKDNKNRVCPKEVAVAAVDQDLTAHWVVSRPCKFEKLSQAVQSENNWLTSNYTGLTWDEGDASAKKVANSLRTICKQAKRVYVRGRWKHSIVQQIIDREVINLENDENCPPFKDLPWVDKYCLQHGLKFCYLKYCCALNNVLRLKEWLKTRDKWSLQAESSFEPPLHLCDDGQPPDPADTVNVSRTKHRSLSCRSNTSPVGATNCLRI